MNFMGMRVILDETFVEDPVLVRREWRERFFSRPWHPFVKTKAIPGDPKFFVDSYHGRLYTCRRGMENLQRAIVSRAELEERYCP